MLSISQIIILLTALITAVLISFLHLSALHKNRRLNLRSEIIKYFVPLLFISLVTIEITYFRYYLTFIFDFGWNAVLLTGTVLIVVTLPVLGLIPARKTRNFIEFPSRALITEPAITIQPIEQRIKAEEMPAVQENDNIEEDLTEQVIPVSEEIAPQETNEIEAEIPLQDKIETAAELTVETAQPAVVGEKPLEEKIITQDERKTEEVKHPHTKKQPVRKTARTKTAPKSAAKKPVVHKTKKKSP